MKIEKETLVNELNKLENEKNNIKEIKSQKNEQPWEKVQAYQ